MISKPLSTMTAVLLLFVFVPALGAASAPDTGNLVISGDGSTFAYPMYRAWIEQFEKDNPAVSFTYVANGSGAGIHDIVLGTVDFAGTDGPLTNTQMLDFSAHRNCQVFHFPTRARSDRACL